MKKVIVKKSQVSKKWDAFWAKVEADRKELGDEEVERQLNANLKANKKRYMNEDIVIINDTKEN